MLHRLPELFKRQVSRTKIMLFKRSSVKATERFCFPNKFELSNMTEFCDTFIMFHLRRLENSYPHKTLSLLELFRKTDPHPFKVYISCGLIQDTKSSIISFVLYQPWTYSGKRRQTPQALQGYISHELIQHTNSSMICFVLNQPWTYSRKEDRPLTHNKYISAMN